MQAHGDAVHIGNIAGAPCAFGGEFGGTDNVDSGHKAYSFGTTAMFVAAAANVDSGHKAYSFGCRLLLVFRQPALYLNHKFQKNATIITSRPKTMVAA